MTENRLKLRMLRVSESSPLEAGFQPEDSPELSGPINFTGPSSLSDADGRSAVNPDDTELRLLRGRRPGLWIDRRRSEGLRCACCNSVSVDPGVPRNPCPGDTARVGVRRPRSADGGRELGLSSAGVVSGVLMPEIPRPIAGDAAREPYTGVRSPRDGGRWW